MPCVARAAVCSPDYLIKCSDNTNPKACYVILSEQFAGLSIYQPRYFSRAESSGKLVTHCA